MLLLAITGSARCRLRRSERPPALSSLKNISSIRHWHRLGLLDLRLPRFHRACPSTALDERVVNWRAVFENSLRMSNRSTD